MTVRLASCSHEWGQELLDDEDEWPTAPNPPRDVPELVDDSEPDPEDEDEPDRAAEPEAVDPEPDDPADGPARDPGAGSGVAVVPGR